MPFVGDADRVGDVRPVGEGDPASGGLLCSPAPSNEGGLSGNGDASFDRAGGEVGSRSTGL